MMSKMVNEVNTDLLKGDYSNSYFLILSRLKFAVDDSKYLNDICGDLFEMLYRNQEDGVSVDEIIGEDEEKFTTELIEAYYGNMDKKRIGKVILKSASTLSGMYITFFGILGGANTRAFMGILLGLIVALPFSIAMIKVKDSFIQRVCLIVIPSVFIFAVTKVIEVTKDSQMAQTAVDPKILIISVIVLLLLGSKFSNYSFKA
ncbi:MAG: hypothetical protein ACRC68_06690 [Clostridium sp.]